MVGIEVFLSWVCAVGGVFGAACSPMQNSGENCDMKVVFLLKELPKYIPTNVKTIIPLTSYQIQDDKLDRYIAAALDAGHQLALSSAIPQSTRKSELQAFRNELAASKAIVGKKFGYEIERLYNSDKMPIMSSVEKAAKNVGFEIFTRSFRVNLMNLDVLQKQAKLATQSGSGKNLVVQASIKERDDVLRLDDFVKKLTKIGYCVEGLKETTNEFFKDPDVFKKNDSARKTRGRSNKKNSKEKISKVAPISVKSGSERQRLLASSLHERLLAGLVQG